MQNLAQKAIKAALSQDWNKAIEIKTNGQDIDSLNRLAYAFMQVNRLKEAKKIYDKILTIDKFNHIAKKNLERIKSLPKTNKNSYSQKTKTHFLPSRFLEEPGLTKIVNLKNIAPFSEISHLRSGDLVSLCTKKHSIEIRDQENNYLGVLPDDLAFRLNRLIKAGNTYEAYLKNIEKNRVTLFIREIKRGKKYSNQPSFSTSISEYNPSISRFIKKSIEKK